MKRYYVRLASISIWLLTLIVMLFAIGHLMALFSGSLTTWVFVRTAILIAISVEGVMLGKKFLEEGKDAEWWQVLLALLILVGVAYIGWSGYLDLIRF